MRVDPLAKPFVLAGNISLQRQLPPFGALHLLRRLWMEGNVLYTITLLQELLQGES